MARRFRHRDPTPFLTTWCPIAAHEVPEPVRRRDPDAITWLAAHTHLLGRQDHLASGLFPVERGQSLQGAVDAHMPVMQARAEHGLEMLEGSPQRGRQAASTRR
jgi:hypothetical protein